MSDESTVQTDRRVNDRRIEQKRRMMMDRRVNTVAVTNDRRKTPRRVSERRTLDDRRTETPNVEGPDWMQEVIEHAQKRQTESPAFTPPAQKIEEATYIDMKQIALIIISCAILAVGIFFLIYI
jgi:hypothetical protein